MCIRDRYSTVSQLGYMALALGVGAWATAIFHLVAHAFFKACLFLGSGSVIHGMHEEQNIQKMGGLRKFMPITFFTFLIASFAKAGVFPVAGFWSKDEIITGAWTSLVFPRFGNVLTVVALITAFISAYYMFRLVFLTFFGKPRFDVEHVHPHESPALMTIPLVILAAVTIVFGAVGYPPDAGRFHKFIEPVFAAGQMHEAEVVASDSTLEEKSNPVVTAVEHEETGHHISNRTLIGFGVLSTILALSGIFLAWLVFLKKRIDPVAFAVDHAKLYGFFYNKWYFDELIALLIVRPAAWIGRFAQQTFERVVIDGLLVGGSTGAVRASSATVRALQTGFLRAYAALVLLGIAALLLYVLVAA